MKKLIHLFLAIIISMVSCKKDMQPETKLPEIPPEDYKIHFTLSEPQLNEFDLQYKFHKDTIFNYSYLNIIELWASGTWRSSIYLKFYLRGSPIKPGVYSFGPGKDFDFDFKIDKPMAYYYFGNNTPGGLYKGTGSITIIEHGIRDDGTCFGNGTFNFVSYHENLVMLILTNGYYEF